MNAERFQNLTKNYPALRIAVVGDFCLDRYLEIDPARQETSIETGLAVHNVMNVRAQPGAAGTILNNLEALGIGEIFAIGFCGEDGEGYELRRVLQQKRGVSLEFFVQTPQRRTFTYCKPLLLHPGRPPEELSRLDSKNWSPTPLGVEDEIINGIGRLNAHVDAVIVMDQVDMAQTGVITTRVLEIIGSLARANPELLILADSRRGLAGYPPVCFKMNRAELLGLTNCQSDLESMKQAAAALARQQQRKVFVTLAEAGMLGAEANGATHYSAGLPVRGEIDIVGAGDAVTANLTAALAAGANLPESMELANAAASIVIHQLGTTGTANVTQLGNLLSF